MEVTRVAISKLKAARYNPKGRTEAKKVSPLRKSIERVGLLSPILITKQFDIVAGHRRVSAVSALGWKDIPAIVVNVESAAD